LPLAREARGDTESSESDEASCRVYQDIGRLEILVDQPASVEATDSAGQGHRESEELPELHRPADKAIEGFAAWVIHHEHGLPALTHQLQWPHCPGTIQEALKGVFVRKAIDALKGWVFCAGSDGYERVRLGVIPPKSAEGTVGVSPQYL